MSTWKNIETYLNPVMKKSKLVEVRGHGRDPVSSMLYLNFQVKK